MQRSRGALGTKADLRRAFIDQARDIGLEPEVLMDGPINAELAIIGEGPGESEIRTGIPFAGGSGNVILSKLREMGYGRHNTYLTNTVKRQISLSNLSNARHAVSRNEYHKWSSLLHWELKQLPNVQFILVLGNYALEAVLGFNGITNYRGSYFPGPNGTQVMVTYNPAYVMREPKNQPIFSMDMAKLKLLMAGKLKPHKVKCNYDLPFKDAIAALQDLKHTKMHTALDIEITAGEVACVGLAQKEDEAYCFNFRKSSENLYEIEEERQVWKALQETVQALPIVCHNGGFDSAYSWQKARLRFDCAHDTMLAHHLLYPQLPHSLGFLTSQYTTHPYYKDEGKLWKEGGDIESFWEYNCKDAAITLTCFKYLEKALEKHGLTEFFYSHVMRVQPHLVQATVHGIACDLALKEKLKDELSHALGEKLEHFHSLVALATNDDEYNVNPNSPTQLADLLFNRLRLSGRGKSTDATNRARILLDARTPPIAKELLAALESYKKDKKFLSTYVEAKLDDDGRFRCTYKQHGVSRAPGRLSSAKTVDGTGLNLQNVPYRGYDMFVADPGCSFIYLDASQAEARVVGWYYEIDAWKEDFERARMDKSFDCHRALAAQMFKCEYGETPTDDRDSSGVPTMRYIAKRCRHGLNYRMQANRLAEVTGLSHSEANRAWKLYHSLTPELRRGWEREERKVRRYKELVNAYGRPWKILSRLDDKTLESIIAFYPQSTIGDHVQRAWYMAEEDEEWPVGKVRIAMNIHDALIGIAEHDVAKRALSIMQRHMEAPIQITNLYGTSTDTLIIPAECKISQPDAEGTHRWSTLKDIVL